jgi:hypothetical protein
VVEKVTPQEIEQLISKARILPTGVLIGLIEILTKKPFNIEQLPFEVDLSPLDDQLLERIKLYVESCVGESESGGKYIYAYKPYLPDHIRNIRTTYEKEILTWKQPIQDSKSNNFQ